MLRFLCLPLFATRIGRQFFPAQSTRGQWLLSLATFGGGFGMRPIGGLVLGADADRAGRKPAMMLTLIGLVMARETAGRPLD